MNTIEVAAATFRRRRRHSAEFKAGVVEACRRPGVSIAAVALANGLNANLLRRWVVQSGAASAIATPKTPPAVDEFVALHLTATPTTAVAAADIRIELRRGAATVSVVWPVQAAGACAAWLREWLR